MPLIKSGSREAIHTNIREMQAAGHPHDQAVAAALNNARRYAHHYADGGVPLDPNEWQTNPLSAAEEAKRQRLQQFIQEAGPRMGYRSPTRTGGLMEDLADLGSLALVPSAKRKMEILDRRVPPFADGGMAFGGPSWTTRGSMHTLQREGFIHSAVPGRTDRLPTQVSGGSYIVPADHVSAIGQNNSLAGGQILSKMFQGPGGMHLSHFGRAPHMPKPPSLGLSHAPRMSAKGGGEHKPAHIIVAGGEFIITPEQLIRKFGSLERGHSIMDHWVKQTRKQHIKTLRKLPPPKVK